MSEKAKFRKNDEQDALLDPNVLVSRHSRRGQLMAERRDSGCAEDRAEYSNEYRCSLRNVATRLLVGWAATGGLMSPVASLGDLAGNGAFSYTAPRRSQDVERDPCSDSVLGARNTSNSGSLPAANDVCQLLITGMACAQC